MVTTVQNEFQSTAAGQGPEYEDHGVLNFCDKNYFESSNANIVLTADAIGPVLGTNYHTGAGADITDQGAAASAATLEGSPQSALANALVPARRGMRFWCTNCNPGTYPCTSGGTGAEAVVVGYNYFCKPGPTPLPTTTPTPTVTPTPTITVTPTSTP